LYFGEAPSPLTGWIEWMEPQFAAHTIGYRWLFVVALSFRILLDFSGYSDMAIGFARTKGIVVPENFNWPYIARSPMEFWQRWHISLSLWIRDYVYIPLGGNRLGLTRRVVNALIAMALCGLWHGPDWNFVAWGFYHGAGLVVGAFLQGRLIGSGSPLIAAPAIDGKRKAAHEHALPAIVHTLSCAATMIFVGIGWLLFVYPINKAARMALQLFGG
jgi:alginate O-acetyltransferase complex protein AlgI